MLFFRNDYGEGCIPSIMKLMQQANQEPHPGYGEDEYTRKACEVLQSKFPDTPCDIHFVVSGTLSNIVMIKNSLRTIDAILATDTAHINMHEAGAIESIGHKIIDCGNVNGKLTATLIKENLRRVENTHGFLMRPKMVYISNATEMGTVYSRKELEEISAVCKENNLYLMMDGARIGSALMSGADYTLNDIAKWCDLFSVGGTKNGALFGEAIVITNNELKPCFRSVQKQCGGILAKGWLLGLQFLGLFQDDDFYKYAKKMNNLAGEIQNYVTDLGYPLFMKSQSNQIILVLTQAEYNYMKDKVDFEIWENWDTGIVIRLVTSWHTSQLEVNELKQILKEAIDLSIEEQARKVKEDLAAAKKQTQEELTEEIIG